MNREDTSKVIAIARTLWPHSTMGQDPTAVLAAWHSMLEPFDALETADALRRLAASGREHAPAPGVVANAVMVARQGNPPSIDEAQRTLARLIASVAPYNARGPEDTAETVRRLAARGVHEAVLRFVAEQGVYAVRLMPDGDEFGLDPNQLADRRDMSRHYRDVTVRGWLADPRPGLALERAERAAVGEGARRELGAGA